MQERNCLKPFLLVLTAFLLFPACTAGMMETILRTYEDPFTEIPKAESFILENTIYLSWSEDPGADEYILERSDDIVVPDYDTVYRGKALSYTDKSLPVERRYLYRLVKIRGNRRFLPSEPVLAVSASIRKDEFEPNDIETRATYLESTRIANINYYLAHTGDEIIDSDWYYVVVPPRRTAYVYIIEGAGNPLDGDDTHYQVDVPGRTAELVTDHVSFEIENPENETRTLYFRIYPNPFFFDFLDGAGGGTVSYSITLNSIE